MNYLSVIKVAIIIFPFIAFLITMPYVLREYHKYGSVYWYRALIVYSFILYLLTAFFLVILPLPTREEVMASEVLRTGKITVEGDGYPAVTVDFGRDASFTKVLAGENTWDKESVNILDNLEDWAGTIQSKSGVVANTVILEPSAWKIFRNNPFVQKYLDYRRGTNNTLNIDPVILGNEKARFVGNIGDFEVWVYNDIYIENDTEKKILPENTVLLGSRSGVEGVRCYGAIKDEQAAFQSTRYFSKSWLENDPAVRWMLLQSAPLVVPYRPNATMCVTIK